MHLTSLIIVSLSSFISGMIVTWAFICYRKEVKIKVKKEGGKSNTVVSKIGELIEK